MAIRYGDRNQKQLFPPSIEEYIEPDAPVRAYDAFVEALDFEELGIDTDSDKIGNPRYDPKAMLKLLVYGYSYGVRSSRKMEREANYNISFIWLLGGLKPDHKTIAEFRRNNKGAIKGVLKQCARLCVELNLISGNTLFVDGSKIRANASIKNSWSRSDCEKALSEIDERIERIFSECDMADESEAGQTSWVRMGEELGDAEALRSRVRGVMKALSESGRKSHNTVDPDCVKFNSVNGSHAGYNAQIVVDGENGLIVSSDAVSESNDIHQFADQINLASETLGRKCETACADAGYAEPREMNSIHEEGIKVVVAPKIQTTAGKPSEFDRTHFRYDDKKDCYICPEGHHLTCRGYNQSHGYTVYRIARPLVCRKCRHFGRCTTNLEGGRIVTSYENEHLRGKFEAEYRRPDSQEIYKLRKEKVELPFGHMKRNLKVDGFLLRGLLGVKAEMSLLSSCFNIARMITILGVKNLIRMLKPNLMLNSS